MKILVLNCGSSSLKYQLINMETEEVMASGKYERIGEAEAFITHKVNGQKIEIKNPAYNHSEAIDFTLKQFTNPEYKVIDSLDEINAIGHRLVHGGEKIAESVVIDDNVVKVLEEYTDLAPLHNPACILGIKACQEVMPGKPMVGVFDTAFHQTMPKDKFIYPIPYEYYKKYGVRKYGFHGTSHMFVSQRLAEIEIASNEGQPDAKIAVENFNYTIASYVAKYAVAMNGVDYIIFTGGIGENQINIRKGICEKLEFMGVKLDVDANNMRGEEKVISTPDSKIKVYVIPTNEELMIAKETLRLVK